MSYLAYPVKGESESLRRSLEAMPECEVQVAENAELLVLVTDTPSRDADDDLTRRLREIPSLAFLGLVAAYADDETETEWHPEPGESIAPVEDLRSTGELPKPAMHPPAEQSSDRSGQEQKGTSSEQR